jgi:hypothetical protein
MFKKFTAQINSLNSYIDVYGRLEVHHQHRKKKFCSNINNNGYNDSDDNNNNNNNNNNNLKSKKFCSYRATDPKGKKAWLEGKTELQKNIFLRDYQIQKVIDLEAIEKKRMEKVNKNLEINMNDNHHVDPVVIPEITSDTSIIIDSTDSSTSSLIIPAPDFKDTIIRVTSKGAKLPKTIDSDLPNGKWNQIDHNKALLKIEKNNQNDRKTSSNKSPSTSKISVSPSSNTENKTKRKRNQNINQTDTPNHIYVQQGSDDDKLDYDLASESDSSNAEENDLPPTTTYPGAFESNADQPPQNN